ncbi:MAG: exo-alpha-sialidase [Victivallales bacterium]|nr:exo-alpha-sialidase [Victivallales bacterium]
MQLEKYTISRDERWYHAWPDLTLASDGALLCVFNECTHHCNRSHTRLMLCRSEDRGRTWSPKAPLTEATDGLPYYYNCPRISRLRDGRLAIVCDRIPAAGEQFSEQAVNVLWLSGDNGKTWAAPVEIPLRGIVPDKLCELETGRWLFAAQQPLDGRWSEYLCYSDDQGKNWSAPVLVASDPALKLCEVSMLPLGGGTIAAFLRENSQLGYDCQKTISHDNGETWGPVTPFPLPGCHRPVAGLLQDGRVFITFRFCQGGAGGMGNGAQNFFAAVTDRRAVLASTRNQARVRIIPIDYDSAPKADTGYSGWIQFPDGALYIANYIVDDQLERGQIRGYALRLDHAAPARPCACCPTLNKCGLCGDNPE